MKNTINKNHEFRRAYYKGNSAPGSKVVVYVVKNRLGVNRLGLTVSKKKIRQSVQRNRCKRLMREAFRTLSPHVKGGLDFVIAAKSACITATCAEVTADMRRLFDKLGVLNEETTD
ncbi:MAG: ribonuclease P protein component [Clostridia bacterium]|nr:ribonuclease P protein component [Clostridia bacterium]